MKRARGFFSRKNIIARKINDRSQSLFARASSSRPRFTPVPPSAPGISSPLLSLCVTVATLATIPSTPLSSSFFLPCPAVSLPFAASRSRGPRVVPPPTPRPLSSSASLYCDLVEKLTRLAGQRIRNYDLSRRRDCLLSRRLWNPGRRYSLFREPPYTRDPRSPRSSRDVLLDLPSTFFLLSFVEICTLFFDASFNLRYLFRFRFCSAPEESVFGVVSRMMERVALGSRVLSLEFECFLQFRVYDKECYSITI